MKFLVYWFFLMVAIYSSAQGPDIRKGVLLDSIPVQQTEGENYALYIPDRANLDSLSSIVFIFDPAGRGKLGIKPFIEAADKYVLILVCSNNNRNTAYAENYNIADRLFKDVFSRFAIDPKRIYAAGFSGGSRLASSIGMLSGAFKAVVGCGAAFSGSTVDMPFADDHFYYAGLVGNQDMNYQEMVKAGQWLDQIRMRNRIFTYDGHHTWPAPEQITKAFDWFYLQDIESGKEPINTIFLDSYFSEALQEAQNLHDTNHIVEAAEQYDYIFETLSKYYKLDSIAVKSNKLRKSKEYKRSLQEKNKIVKEEASWTARLMARVHKESAIGESPDNFRWWKKELGRLEEDYSTNSRLDYQHMGNRLQRMIFAVGIESFELAMAQKDQKKAIYYARFMTAIWPKNAYVHFRIAGGYAEMDKVDAALSHLEAALENGWDNKQLILRTKSFDRIKNQSRFQLLLEQLQ